MAVSISLVMLLGVGVFIAWRFTGLRAWHAILCIVFGFYLAQTGAAPEIQHLITSLINVLSSGQKEVMPPLDTTFAHQMDLQETLTRYTNAMRTIRATFISRILLHVRVAVIAAALDTIPGLCEQAEHLRSVMAVASIDHANLIAAARSTLMAERDGEPDPLWYLRDELAERGQLPGAEGGTGAVQ